MKITLQYLLALSFILSSWMAGNAQSSYRQTAAESRQPLPAVTVDIKVYLCPEEGQSLLAYDPNQHSLFIFSCEDYLVNWSRNGQSISNEAMLRCVREGVFHVEVIHRSSGVTGSATLFVAGDKQKKLNRFENSHY